MQITRQKSGCCPMSCIPHQNNTLSCWGLRNGQYFDPKWSISHYFSYPSIGIRIRFIPPLLVDFAPASAVSQQRGATTWRRRIFVEFGSWFHSNYSTKEHFYIIKIFEGNELLSGRVVTNYWRSYVVWPGGYGFQFDNIGLRVLASPHKEHRL